MSIHSATIFVPRQLEKKKSGPLYGRFKTTSGTTAQQNNYAVVLSTEESQAEHIIGYIGNDSSNSSQKNSNVWLELRRDPYITIKSFSAYSHDILLETITLVYFDNEEIWESELIPHKYSFINRQNAENVLPYFVQCVVNEEDERYQSKIQEKTAGVVVLLEILMFALMVIPKILLGNIHSILQDKLDYSSNALQQITLRINQFEKLTELLKNQRRRSIINGRLMTMIFVDVIFGMTVAYVISHHASVSDMYDTFCNWTKILSSCVQDLLEWLSGAPAGLKLNQPLTQTLSAFFSYHVHLWRLYLELADPLLKGLAWILVWLGMFGLSIQVAILSDLLDLATLHLYCFYVYAARIHMLQISLLGSQWRAFRGRKWNPLKLRIDSDTGNHMSLKRVLTAVVFTLVIFLLPTTTVYYMVFVMLRISLSTLRGILSMGIWLLNSNPLFLVMLNMTGSNRIKGDIYLRICDSSVDQPSSVLKFQLNTWPTPVSEALSYATSDVLPPKPSLRWKCILKSVVFGRDLL